MAYNALTSAFNNSPAGMMHRPTAMPGAGYGIEPNAYSGSVGMSPGQPQRNALSPYMGEPYVPTEPESSPWSMGEPVGGALQIVGGTRAQHSPRTGLNISMDFNASPNGGARGTEVIIPDNASPEVRAAAERFNDLVADFARQNGIADYPVRGVRTRSENGRGVSNTVHVEPFFNDDRQMKELVAQNPAAFARLYQEAFGNIEGRLIAPHGVGRDRGAASDIFGDETSYGELMISQLQGGQQASAPAPAWMDEAAQRFLTVYQPTR